MHILWGQSIYNETHHDWVYIVIRRYGIYNNIEYGTICLSHFVWIFPRDDIDNVFGVLGVFIEEKRDSSAYSYMMVGFQNWNSDT